MKLLNIFQPILYILKFYLILCGIGSIWLGALGALSQVKLKRFIGYGSIAHSGYIILGLSCNSITGAISAMLYLLAYSFAILGFFTILLNTDHILTGSNICFFNQVHSLFFYNKEISFHLLMVVGSMAAIPPFSSFFIKFFIYTLFIDGREELPLITILIGTMLSLYYYLCFIQDFICINSEEMMLYIYEGSLALTCILRVNAFILLFG